MSELEITKTYGLFDNQFNKKLIADLKQRGEKLLILPPVRAFKLDLDDTAAGYLKNLSAFDWLVLTDVFAADYFIESLGEHGMDFFELDEQTVCAIGEAVADRLRFVQVHADVIPSKIADEAVFSAISNYAGSDLKDLKFLVVGEKSAVFPFAESLKNERASVRQLPVYEAEFADEAEIIKLKTLLTGGAVDDFVFSSPEDLLSLRFLLSGADFQSILNETKISATSEVVYQTLQENGLRPLYFHYK
jgi:uroporphyrinogen-III synthase